MVGPPHLAFADHVQDLIVAAADGAIMAAPVGDTLPIHDGSERPHPKDHTGARAKGCLREKSPARGKKEPQHTRRGPSGTE